MNIDLESKYQILLGEEEADLSIKDICANSSSTIIYFYPKDCTPGCTIEAQDFSSYKNQFTQLGIQVLGVSKDSIDSHKIFSKGENLRIPLIADTTGKLHREFGVIGEKNMYGKIMVGVIRSTFLLDGKGNVVKEWRNVKATGHVEKLLKELSK